MSRSSGVWRRQSVVVGYQRYRGPMKSAHEIFKCTERGRRIFQMNETKDIRASHTRARAQAHAHC